MISPDQLDERLITLKNLSVEERYSLLTETSSKAAFVGECRRTPGTDSCSNCGACCQRVLPLSPEEVKAIQNLLKENFKLRKYILALNKGLPLRMCPFMDFTQREHKCLIYTSSARPLICKFYTCNQKVLKKDPPESHYPPDTRLLRTDMWHTFFQKATAAPDIAPAWTDMDLLHEYNFRPPHEFMLMPEKLHEFFTNFHWSRFLFQTIPRQDIPPRLLYSCTDEEVRDFLGHYAEKKNHKKGMN